MLFENGIFTPHLLENERTEAVLQAATDHASGKIRPSDILLVAIDSRDARILAKLRQFLAPGCSPQELRDIIEAYNPAGTTHSQFNGERRWFSHEALAALDQFDTTLKELGKKDGLRYVMLELLLSCVLSHLDAEDKEYLTPLKAQPGAEGFLKVAESLIEPLPPLIDTGSKLLRSGEFAESGWAIMEHAATRATDLGYESILPPHCFLALLSEAEGVAEHLIRLQAQPDTGPTKVAQLVTEAFRVADVKVNPLKLNQHSIGEAMIQVLKTAQRTARLWGAEKIDSSHLLSALLEGMPPRLASVLQSSPLKLDLRKMRTHLEQYLIDSLTQVRKEFPFRIPAGLLPSEDLTYRAGTDEGLPKAVIASNQKETDHYDVMTRALYRRINNHVLITGLRGVGKTTLVWELARRANAGEIPFLKRKRFLWVDCRDVASHESKDKLAGILSHVTGRTDLILCLDGLGPLLRAESGGNNKLLLRSALKDSRVQLIGVMSNNDFEDLLSSDYEVLELFTRVKVEQPDEGTALAIVKQACIGLQQDYNVTIEERAIKLSVDLSASYILNECLPIKAIKILRRVCEDLDYERTQATTQQVTETQPDSSTVKTSQVILKASQVIKVIAEISGVPEETLAGQAKKYNYKEALEKAVVGQNEAVEAVATTLRLIKAGMTDPSKPAAVMLFAGLTGVGKTELAKALAQLYSSSKRLQTYTMGNFTEPHSVSGIIGVPPGYVGHDQGGRLINDLNSDPYCVFLLDEAEKAHPDVWKPFLNLFDEGWIVDARGVKAFADRAIFILTSNEGHEIISEKCREDTPDMDEISRAVKKELTEPRDKKKRPAFTPEFLARINRIIIFKPLDERAMRGICMKLIEKMEKIWKEKREKTLVIPTELIDYIAKKSHLENKSSGGKEGGRIVNKLITDLIEATIQDQQSKSEEEYKQADEIVLSFLPPAEGEQPHQRSQYLNVDEFAKDKDKVKVHFPRKQSQSPAMTIAQATARLENMSGHKANPSDQPSLLEIIKAVSDCEQYLEAELNRWQSEIKEGSEQIAVSLRQGLLKGFLEAEEKLQKLIVSSEQDARSIIQQLITALKDADNGDIRNIEWSTNLVEQQIKS